MARHLERARHSCRLLSDQIATMEDRPVEEIERCWRRLYRALSRRPFGGHVHALDDDEDFMLASAYTLADDLTFESSNPDAIRNCVAAARESARRVRNAIGRDMWSCLNLAYLDLRDLHTDAIWSDRPNAFYVRTEDSIRAFSGIAESAMYRDEGWHFLQLGRFVERAQLLVALIDAHIGTFPTESPHREREWRSLLDICEAHFAYRQLYSLQHRPTRIVDFLVADSQLAHSIRYALGAIADGLDAVAATGSLHIEAGRRAGRMMAWIDYDWPNRDPLDDDATRRTLRGFGDGCRRLHDDISAAFFDYEIEDSP